MHRAFDSIEKLLDKDGVLHTKTGEIDHIVVNYQHVLLFRNLDYGGCAAWCSAKGHGCYE